jgi:MraZ protein
MLIGEYIHTLDEKRRLSLPSKLRKEIGKRGVLTRGLDNCIFLYPEKQWVEITEKLATLSLGQAQSRGFHRFMLSGATEVDIDSAGRILIPDFLKEFAQLGQRVVLAGVYNRIEIWNEESWNDYTKKIENEADTLAQTLGDIGMI